MVEGGSTLADSTVAASSADVVTGLYVTEYASLVRLAALLLDEPAACEDVVQEAYIRAWSAQARLRDPAAAHAYLRQVVVNLSRSVLRRRLIAARRNPARRVDDVSGADVAALTAVMRDEAVRALAGLPRRQREVLALRYFAQCSERETATALGISVGSVKGYGSRGIAALAEQMREWR
jgi:RNA polymerase sigma-70 factor (sigma-E family)